MTWIIRHPNGYWAGRDEGGYEDLPINLLENSKGSVAANWNGDGEPTEVRTWTGRKWEQLIGADKEHALNWLIGGTDDPD